MRPMDRFLRNTFGDRPLVGIEVGVAEGHHAYTMLQRLNISQLHLIDPYIVNPNLECYSEEDLRRFKEEALERLAPYADKIVWHYESSVDAWHHLLEEGQLADFVYLDGDHSREAAEWDITHYFELLREGGYIGGHDYCIDYRVCVIEVKQAVDAFVKEHNFELTVEGEDDWPDWWIAEPRSPNTANITGTELAAFEYYSKKAIGDIVVIEPTSTAIFKAFIEHSPSSYDTWTISHSNLYSTLYDAISEDERDSTFIVSGNSSMLGAKWRKPIGLLFIDDVSSYQEAKDNFEVWSPWILPDGVLAFHSDVDPSVADTLDEQFTAFVSGLDKDRWKILEKRDTMLFLRRKSF